MKDQTIEQLARCAGATNEKGGRAASVFCFEKHELLSFANSLIKTYKYVEKECCIDSINQHSSGV